MKNIEAVAAVIMQGGRVFCAQRKDEGETARLWEFPGGKIEAGETHSQALEREIREELEAGISVEDFIMTISYQYVHFNLTMHAYRCRLTSGEIVLREHLASRWLAADELDSLPWAPADLPIVARAKELLEREGSSADDGIVAR